MASETPTGICSLPNELLLYILNPLPTRRLLPLTTVCHRFHDLVLRIIHRRLINAANITDHTLILECYHTSAKFTEPPLFCQYLGTDGLDTGPGNEGWAQWMSAGAPVQSSVGQLAGLYSKFLPRRREADVSRPARYRAGDIPGSRTHPSTATSRAQLGQTDDLISQVVTLESHELFTQLCAVTNLAKAGPRSGLFLSLVEVSDGIIRIFRDWLARQAEGGETSLLAPRMDSDDKGKDRLRDEDEDRILWVNDGKNVGLRFRVKERKWNRDNPILLHRDEGVAVSYTIQFEELLVRTTHLLLMMDRSVVDQQSNTGKAIVFGSLG